MKGKFYKQRQNRILAGVVAGLADKYGWDLVVARVIAGLLMYTNGFGILIYILLAIFLPYKEDLMRSNSNRPRSRKEADAIKDEDDGWFW
ncbi:PspC domain-containing protein [Streptococcus didelphis]|uniref:PspC domain-containing protein n=1 Tax=Streptococcus didelphis TaxID=102886 RepID=A0ABY9LHT4_9STRE|nr:PspC domain-containing protein [Streptococcus didelphis]WMB28456.1 PspC domain-containing protein [Streptococcus didelphis]WMB29132.1 PspC domain-containing protein [Streptococcus didelphis]